MSADSVARRLTDVDGQRALVLELVEGPTQKAHGPSA